MDVGHFGGERPKEREKSPLKIAPNRRSVHFRLLPHPALTFSCVGVKRFWGNRRPEEKKAFSSLFVGDPVLSAARFSSSSSSSSSFFVLLRYACS